MVHDKLLKDIELAVISRSIAAMKKLPRSGSVRAAGAWQLFQDQNAPEGRKQDCGDYFRTGACFMKNGYAFFCVGGTSKNVARSLEQMNFETLHSELTAKIHFAYSSRATDADAVGRQSICKVKML